jgi:Fe-S-cluster containining protein
MKKQTRKKKQNDNLCFQCNARCCKYISIEIDAPTDKNDFENIRWFVSHHNIWVFKDEGLWYICFDSPCRYLEKDNRCGIYDERPDICRKYKTDNCEYHGEENEGFELKFTTPQEVSEYAEEYLRKKKKRLQRINKG